MSWIVAAAAMPGWFVAWAVSFLIRAWASCWGLVDRPGHRKVHTKPVPYGGGVAIWIGVFVPLAIGQLALWLWQQRPPAADRWQPVGWLQAVAEFIEPHLPGLVAQASSLWFLIAAGTVLMLLGLIDDIRRLDWRLRLAVEFAVAAAVVWLQGWKLTVFVELPVLTDLLSVLWIVGLVNAVNFLDNMDGLAGGVSAIAATLLGVYLLLVPQSGGPQLFVAGLAFLLVGALGGFLWHNRPPARLFMGDAGSYFVGYCLAVLTILATFSGPGVPGHAILAPLCVLAIPLYDSTSVILIRLSQRRSPFEGDTNHFSHRLVALGLSKPQAVMTIYLTSAACGLGALVLPQVDTIGALVVVAIIACLLSVIAILEFSARRSIRSDRERPASPPLEQ